jgi:hypothetical protein
MGNNNSRCSLHAATNGVPEGGDVPNWIAAWEPQLILPLARLELSASAHVLFPWAPANRVQFSAKQ